MGASFSLPHDAAVNDCDDSSRLSRPRASDCGASFRTYIASSLCALGCGVLHLTQMILRHLQITPGEDIEVPEGWQTKNVHLAKDGVFHVLLASPDEK